MAVKLVMLLLVIASVTSWWIIFAKWMVLKSASSSSKKFEETFWSGVDLNRLYDTLMKRKKKATGMEQIFESGFREFLRTRKSSKSGVKATESADRAMRIALNREIDSLESHLPFFSHHWIYQSLCRIVGNRDRDYDFISCFGECHPSHHCLGCAGYF